MVSLHMFRLLALHLALAAALAGCAAGPDPRAPVAPAASALVPPDSGIPVPAPAPVQAQWWRAYGSPRLDALVERALARNPGLAGAEAALRQAQALVQAQRGVFRPQVGASLSPTRQNVGDTQASPLNSGAELYSLVTAQLSVGYVPDVFGGNRRAVEAVQAVAEAQRLQLVAARTTLAATVAVAAIQEQLLLQQREAAQAAARLAGEQLEHTRRLRDAGSASALELAQQEAATAQVLSLGPPLERQLAQTRHLLAVLCGDLPAQAPPMPGAPDALDMPQALPGVLPGALLAQRPDVAAAQAQLQAALAQVGVARAAQLPAFSISAGLAWTSTALGSLFSAPVPAWSLGAGVLAPVVNGGALRARREAAEAAADQAQQQWQQAVLTAYQNVADTLAALDADRRALDNASQAEAATGRLSRLTDLQLQLGQVAQPQALAARQGWLQARLALLAARASLLVDTVALYQALGGGWTREDATASVE